MKSYQIYEQIQKCLKGKLFHYLSVFLIIISIIAIIFSSYEECKPYKTGLFGVVYCSAFIFLLEYFSRVFSAPAVYLGTSDIKARLKYIFSFYGLVDFTAMLPFPLVYLYWNSDIVQLIVLPYIFIIFKLIRYSKAFQLIGTVLKEAKDELLTAYTACGIVICFSAILMYFIEKKAQPETFKNIGDGLWWSVVTFTTVGYGDIYPITPLGKLLSGIISFIGIGMIALPTAIISSAFMNIIQKKRPNH